VKRRPLDVASIAIAALAALALAAVVLFTSAGYTQTSQASTTWQVGDLFLGAASGSYQVREPNGTLKETLNGGGSGYSTGCAFDSGGNFYGTELSNNLVRKYLGPSAPHTASTFGGGYADPESIAFDAAGNVYVGNVNSGIRQFASNGKFLQTITSARVDWFDIAADQDTILYTQEGNDVKALSITSGPLSNFTTGTATQAFALRILGDGGVLLADLNNVKRYNSAGNVVQTYDQPGEDSWFSLNLDPNGTSFWAGDFNTSHYYEFNISSGLLEAGPLSTGTAVYTLFGICIFGELTNALPTATAPAGATNTSTHTPTNTPTHTPTNTPTHTPTNTPTRTPTNTPTHTPSGPTNTPTQTASGPTNTPTQTASGPTNTPTRTPSRTNTPLGTVVFQETTTPAITLIPPSLGGVADRPNLSSGGKAGLLFAALATASVIALGAAGLFARSRRP
jgi:hypothetical protein